MKQLILITDGCSNVGISPIAAAAQAKAEGIIVHVIGIVDQMELGALGAQEISDIAEAGGGMSRIVKPAALSQTVQMMTRQTVTQTIQQAVTREIRQVLGDGRIERLPPEQRSEVVRIIDDLTETTKLQVALLIDTSASMKPKIATVKEAICDLQLSLQARTGESLLSVFHFPGNHSSEPDAELDVDWTRDLASLQRMFYKLNMKGTTPTGPAILRVIHFITGKSDDTIEGIRNQGAGGMTEREATAGSGTPRLGKDGIWSDYVV